jgi:uncharacterized membrane protein YGL010W
MTDVLLTSPAARLRTLMLRYGESHQNLTNQRLHLICVPAIMMSTLGMLASIPSFESVPINFGHFAVALASIYYFQFRNIRLLVGVWMMAAACFLVISTFGPDRFIVSIGIFVIAWIGQFIGHKIEGKKPSFFEDIFFLLIGPLWVLYKIAPSILSDGNSNQGFTK